VELTGYLDFWFADLPIVERVARFAALDILVLDVWLWRERPMADLYAECRRHGCLINSTFDPLLGSLVDADDHPSCRDAWAESLEMAECFRIPPLFVFSNQVEVRPNGEHLGLEAAGVCFDKTGILVNNRMQTDVPDVYAIGDVIGGALLAHVAMRGGEVAVENALGQAAIFDPKTVP
jgi:hypothetical protein